MSNRYTSLLSFYTRTAILAIHLCVSLFHMTPLISIRQHGVAEASFGVGSQTAASLVFPENSVEQRRLIFAPVVVDLATQLVERVGDLVHLVGSGHLGEVTVKILGENLSLLEGHLPQVNHIPLVAGERQVTEMLPVPYESQSKD